MESTDGPAGDSNESERKNLARENRTGTIHEAREGRHVEGGMNRDDADTEEADGSKLHERAEVITGSKQQPDRHDRRGECVDDDRDGESRCTQGKYVGRSRVQRDPLPSPDRE